MAIKVIFSKYIHIVADYSALIAGVYRSFYNELDYKVYSRIEYLFINLNTTINMTKSRI